MAIGRLTTEERIARDRARARAYYEKHREERKAIQRAYAAAHKEPKRLSDAKYRQANAEKCRQRGIRYREEHRAAVLKAKKEWYRKHRQEVIDRMTAWRAANPDRARGINTAACHRRRARKASVAGHWNATDLRVLSAILGDACLRCGSMKSVTIDHVIPLALGGSNHPTNLQPLCRSCNNSKQARSRSDYRTPAQVRRIMKAFQLTIDGVA